MDSPEVWRWIWLVTAGVFGAAEVVTPVAFLFLPFAIGAIAASAAAFAGVDVAPEWLVFVVVTAIAYGVLWPIGRRLTQSSHAKHSKAGANRWVGREAVVTTDIPGLPGSTGMVRLEREQWRAETGNGVPIPAGSTVLVTRVDGTRLVVLPLDVAPPSLETGDT